MGGSALDEGLFELAHRHDQGSDYRIEGFRVRYAPELPVLPAFKGGHGDVGGFGEFSDTQTGSQPQAPQVDALTSVGRQQVIDADAVCFGQSSQDSWAGLGCAQLPARDSFSPGHADASRHVVLGEVGARSRMAQSFRVDSGGQHQLKPYCPQGVSTPYGLAASLEVRSLDTPSGQPGIARSVRGPHVLSPGRRWPRRCC